MSQRQGQSNVTKGVAARALSHVAMAVLSDLGVGGWSPWTELLPLHLR